MTNLDNLTMASVDGRYVLESSLWLPRALEELWPFFADAHNLERITPDFLHFAVVTPAPLEMNVGTRIDYRLRIHGVPVKWRTRITVWEPPFRFTDFQTRGPYALWDHEHRFAERDGGTLCTDRVVYRLPLGPLGRLAHAVMVKRDVRRIFVYRSEALRALFPAR